MSLYNINNYLLDTYVEPFVKDNKEFMLSYPKLEDISNKSLKNYVLTNESQGIFSLYYNLNKINTVTWHIDLECISYRTNLKHTIEIHYGPLDNIFYKLIPRYLLGDKFLLSDLK